MEIEFIKPYAEMISVRDPYKKIELCGRNCYKSTSPLTDKTAWEFYQMLQRKQHTAMLEHATFVFELTGFGSDSDEVEFAIHKWGRGYLKYTRSSLKFGEKFRVLVSGNLRAIIESGINFLNDALCDRYPNIFADNINKLNTLYSRERVRAEVVNLNEYSSLTKEEVDNHHWSTFFITTDRGVTHEIVRHRPVSYAQESTRYVNYAKSEVKGIASGITIMSDDKPSGLMKFIVPADFESWKPHARADFEETCKFCANRYEYLITKGGCSAQQVRGILPHAVKADIIMTTNDEEWKHFFDLRYHGTTGAPHPNMKEVAELVYKLWEEDFAENYESLIS